MELNELRIFYTVAKKGSISHAAQELNYAQSNITLKIQQLEKKLQTTLFYRHNRGIVLTKKGEKLVEYSEKIFRLVDETIKVIQDNEIPQGSLELGSMETTAAVRLPSLLSEYHHKFPSVELTLKTGTTEQNINGVLKYELDGAFVAGPIYHPELNQKVVVEEKLVLVTSNIHPPLASIKDIQNRNLLVFRKGCSYRSKLEQWLHSEGIIPIKIMEFGTIDAILGCVAAGLGITMLPYSVIEKHIYSDIFKYHSIPNIYGSVETIFIYRNDTFIPTALTKFIEMFTKEHALLSTPL